MRDPIRELQTQIDACMAKTGLKCAIHVKTVRQDDGSAHVEVVSDAFDIVVTERGSEIQRYAGLSLLEAARWFVFGMAVDQAQSMELNARQAPKNASLTSSGLVDDGYSRWNWMAPAIETMGRVSPDFGDWARKHYDAVLRNAPLKEHEKRNARWPLPPHMK